MVKSLNGWWIGAALMNIVGVYKEIQDQQMNILKAFYVDLLVPLETNLEKDTKVVQFEQKRFMQQHKVRTDSYSKAAATMKKQRKKKPSAQNADKEIKSIQALEEEKNKLDAFCEQSLKNAMTQERRRYGFVLERQCSLAKHWMAYHAAGKGTIEDALDNWQDVAATREFLPPNVESMFTRRIKDFSEDESDRLSISSALRKTRSIDASCLDMRSLGDVMSNMQMPRAKSEFNLTTSTINSNHQDMQSSINWDQRPVTRALYAYLSSGENQLSFLEGDRIALVGERAKGWQFGENLRTQMFGWFPVAYTGPEPEPDMTGMWDSKGHPMDLHQIESAAESSLESTLVDEPTGQNRNSYHLHNQNDTSPTRMFGDTILYRQSKQFRGISGGGPKPGPPPTLPAPVPTPVVPPYAKGSAGANNSGNHLTQSHSFSSSGGTPMGEKHKPATANYGKQNGSSTSTGGKTKPTVTSASLHSSNDSGFANEPPPQPEVDYSDEETVTRMPIRSSRSEKRHSANTTLTRSIKNRSNTNTLESTKSRGTLIRQSSSYGNLADENTMEFLYGTTNRDGTKYVKRTKSFWRFGKQPEDIMEGMAMWRHRDLVQTEQERREERRREENTIKRRPKTMNGDMMNGNSDTLVKNGRPRKSEIPVIDDHAKYRITKSEIDHRIGKQKSPSDESLYGGQQPQPQQQQPQKKTTKTTKSESGTKNGRNGRFAYSDIEDGGRVERRMQSYETRPEDSFRRRTAPEDEFKNGDLKYYDDMMIPEPGFYDDDSVNDVVMKTVKRKEILKQYYSSGTDTERNSSSSDPYDCIVVEDHLVKRENGKSARARSDKMEFSTFRGGEGKDKRSSGAEEVSAGTLLPRTKLAKPGPMMQTVMKMDKEQENNREGDGGKRRKENNSNSAEKRASKAYGPWYDLWSNETPLSQK
uniref:Insulin receptor tyrosine kinase substrate n=1 Tax=Phlebotomus papatasi TaxID=29031 RepID=A0A1B0D054_PHLPP